MIVRRAVALLSAVCLLGCAPYRIGTDSLYSCKIRTVYVPIFESASFRRNLGERLTEAVQKEIERRTPYKVVSSPDADSILTCKILTEAKGVSVEAPTDEPRELTYFFTIGVNWVNRDGVVIQEMTPIALPGALMQLMNTSTFYPEVGQSISTAQQDSMNRIARQIVGMMESPW
ncbi:MAG: hypothetical protein K8U03_19925 [Planctomycetia bacterium]|nr:hypothetical protein [Planctomycetia bacterium]